MFDLNDDQEVDALLTQINSIQPPSHFNNHFPSPPTTDHMSSGATSACPSSPNTSTAQSTQSDEEAKKVTRTINLLINRETYDKLMTDTETTTKD